MRAPSAPALSSRFSACAGWSAAKGKATVIMRRIANRPTEELGRIGAASKGRVVFAMD